MLFDDSERIKKRLFHFLRKYIVARNVFYIRIIPIKLCNPRTHLSLQIPRNIHHHDPLIPLQ